jgi:hypothetical protein
LGRDSDVPEGLARGLINLITKDLPESQGWDISVRETGVDHMGRAKIKIGDTRLYEGVPGRRMKDVKLKQDLDPQR